MKRLIVYITTFYPTEQRPWHGIYFQDHAEALAEHEDVAVMYLKVSSFRKEKTLRSTITTRKKNNVFTISAVQPMLTLHFNTWVNNVYYSCAEHTLHKIEQHYGRKPDLLIAQGVLPAGDIARKLSEVHAIPYGTIDHFSLLGTMFEKQGDEMKCVYNNAAFTAVVSRFLAKRLCKYTNIDGVNPVIGNVLGRIFEKTDQMNSGNQSSQSFKWLFVGPDDRSHKGVDLLYESLKRLTDRQWTLTIVGHGEFKQLKNGTFAQRITHFPHKNRRGMVKLMQQHNALISTSRIETFGMPIIEILSQGRPVVATRCGGPDEYLKPHCGCLVEKNSERIAAAMYNLMENYRDYNPALIRQYVLGKFGSDPFYQKMNRLFCRNGI